jgi:Raf kinase inhibitor-like YbhB/YbcL family protein
LLALAGCSSSDSPSPNNGPSDSGTSPDGAKADGGSSIKDSGTGDGKTDATPSGDDDDDSDAGDDDQTDSAAPDADVGPFTLTSTEIGNNDTVPEDFTCETQSSQNAQGTGGNASPPLAWSGVPAGTKSFAIVLHDTGNNNTHWVLYDIPATVTSLPKGIAKTASPATPAGSKQVKSYDNSYGYMGPCPNQEHVYTFTVYAMPTATTPGINAGDRGGAEKAVKDAAIDSAVLSVKSSASQG